MAVSPLRLDHVALWVADRNPIAQFATAHLGMHEIELTDKFTLLGSDARRGKLTLFASEGPREPGPLQHVAFRVSSFGAALSSLPRGIALEPSAGRVVFDVAGQLQVGLVETTTPVEYDLDHVTLAVPDPERSAAAWQLLGFHPARPLHGVARVGVAGAYLELVEGDGGQP
jgi:catechol 2,3-dioxygenase-like lactoylglutathione lyase family enzyme